MCAANGMDALFFGRADYQDMAVRTQSKALELVWRGAASWGAAGDVWTSNYPTGNYVSLGQTWWTDSLLCVGEGWGRRGLFFTMRTDAAVGCDGQVAAAAFPPSHTTQSTNDQTATTTDNNLTDHRARRPASTTSGRCPSTLPSSTAPRRRSTTCKSGWTPSPPPRAAGPRRRAAGGAAAAPPVALPPLRGTPAPAPLPLPLHRLLPLPPLRLHLLIAMQLMATPRTCCS